MGEISAVSAGRAAFLRNDARNLRLQEERNAQSLLQDRQVELGRQSRALEEQLALDRNRANTSRGDLNQDNADRRLFDAQLLSQDIRFTDRRLQNREDDAEVELLRARELDVERALPPLTPRQPIGGLITPEELEIQRQLAEPDRPPPVGLPPLEERVPPPTPFESPGVAAIDDFEPAPFESPGVAAIDDFEPAPAAGQTEEPTFALQERDRAARLTERRTEVIDSQVRQEVDLQLAQDRIDEANFDPERPRGTLVDIFG